MDWSDLRQMLTDWASRIVRFTRIARAASDGSASVEGRTIPGGPEAPSIRARLMFPFGVRSVPPAGVDAAVVHAAGAGARCIVVACDAPKYGPSDLAEGETALYSQQNPKAVHADGAGHTKITSATVNGVQGDVVVNGGTLPVARKTDPIAPGAITMTAATAPGPPPVTTVTLVYTPPGGAPTTIGVLVFTAGLLTAATPGAATMGGKIADGAPHLLA